jgi:hypothetical protein
VILVQELENSIRYYKSLGPAICADASDLADAGVEALVEEVLDALGLSRSAVTWVADSTVQREAAEFAAKVLAAKGAGKLR